MNAASASNGVAPNRPALVHGWAVYLHPLFRAQLQNLQNQVNVLQRKEPANYHRSNAVKRLAAIARLAFDVIPQDPARPEYRQGGTLGVQHKHWFRAKFFQQYRLFFRYHTGSKIIVYAWVNDEDTKRAYGSDDDAYRVFKKMLLKGNPPNDWEALLRAANREH